MILRGAPPFSPTSKVAPKGCKTRWRRAIGRKRKEASPSRIEENEVPDRSSPDEQYSNEVVDGSKMITSTPSQISSKTLKQPDFFSENKEIAKPDFVQLNEFPQGSFFGFGRHKDGSEINIMYQVCIVVIYE